MRWTVGTKIGMGFGLALAVLAAIGVTAYLSTRRLVDNGERVTHTHQVLETLESILSLMKDAETGQRGFVLTGKDSYLEPYTGAKGAIGTRINDLRDLTHDNKDQQ